MTQDKQFANHKSRTENPDKLPVTTPETIANSAYKASETKPVLEKVKLKPMPELDASIGFFEALFANLQLFWRQNIVKYFRGEPVENPLAPLSFLRTGLNLPTSLLIGLAVLGVLFVLLRWIV